MFNNNEDINNSVNGCKLPTLIITSFDMLCATLSYEKRNKISPFKISGVKRTNYIVNSNTVSSKSFHSSFLSFYLNSNGFWTEYPRDVW